MQPVLHAHIQDLLHLLMSALAQQLSDIAVGNSLLLLQLLCFLLLLMPVCWMRDSRGTCGRGAEGTVTATHELAEEILVQDLVAQHLRTPHPAHDSEVITHSTLAVPIA